MYTAVGGSLIPSINIRWSGGPPVSPEDIDKQVVHAQSLKLPSVKARAGAIPSNGRKLAVIGGGPSINEHVETFKNWDGDIWTINGAYHWCTARGIASTFIACDPHPIVADWAKNVKRALVTTRCSPMVFEVLEGADTRVFDLDGENRVIAGSSTASCSIHLAILDGYKDVTYFGCESSYPPGGTHAYMHEPRKDELVVLVGDEEFHTAPDYLIQAQEMAHVFREAEGIKEESGGLLRALIKNPKFRITWISEGLWNGLQPVEQAA